MTRSSRRQEAHSYSREWGQSLLGSAATGYGEIARHDSRLDPLKMVGTRSTASVTSPDKMGHGGTRPCHFGGWLVLRLGLLFAMVVAFPGAAFAHRLDEYLQATLVAIQPGEIRLQMNLTPGVTVADKVLQMIDRDGDGVISTKEAQNYADLLRRELTVRLDQREIKLDIASSYFPSPEELRSGWGFIQLEFRAKTGTLAAGRHKIAIENRHLPSSSVYLINAALPKSGNIKILAQNRNPTQSTGEIEFNLDRQRGSLAAIGMLGSVAVLLAMVAMLRNDERSRMRGTK